jgi:hypothetical protein
MRLQNERERRSRRIATERSRSRKARLLPPQCLVLVLVVFFHTFCTTTTTAAAQAGKFRSNLRTQEDDDDKDNDVQISSKFPTLNDTLEMASLSLLVYAFRNEPDDDHVCQLINSHNNTYTNSLLKEEEEEKVPSAAFSEDIQCHWYQHDRVVQGTQVLIVSSVRRNYLAIVFAGTDDIRSSLTDANIVMKPFGDGVNFTVPDPRVKIHAGFDNAVFNDDLFQNILERINYIRLDQPLARLFTTGHSLGASDSVLTAVGLTLYYQQRATKHHVPIVTSLNFGCPRMGNSYWRDFVHMNPALNRHIGIWRFVLGWDLVPRLPEFAQADAYYHAGHTVQLYKNSVSGQEEQNSTAEAYYQHHGDIDLGLAGVPFGWASKPFIWVPGSLWSHHIRKYYELLHEWAHSSLAHQNMWLQDFVRVDPDNPDGDDDGLLPNVDDDFWVDPPDDDAVSYS